MDIKHILKYGVKLLTSYHIRFNYLAGKGLYDNMSDEEFLKRVYRANRGKKLNLENPETFNEKLQWMKLYDRNPLYTVTSDKYAVRDYVREKIGEEYLVPLLGVWDSPDDIDFDALPDQFVLKCNHNSGKGMCICRDKSKLDIKKTKEELKKGLEQDYFLVCREWQYKNIKRRIIGEKFLSVQGAKDLVNYKIYCFDGEPKFFHISGNMAAHDHDKARLSFLSLDWEPLPFHREDYPTYEVLPKEPVNKDKMLELARKLSEDFSFMRVDLYEINGKIYFSELTLDPCGGYNPFQPEEWDMKLGEMLTLPSVTAD